MSKTERALESETLDREDGDEVDDGGAVDRSDRAAPPAGNGHREAPVVPGEPLVRSEGAARVAAPPEAPPPEAPPQEEDRPEPDALEEKPAPEVGDVDDDAPRVDQHADREPPAVDRRTPPEAEPAPAGTPVPDGLVGPEPSEDVLEELRRADVDGPTVKMAPHDDTTAARRRPRRLPEYDPAPIPVPTKIPRVLGRKPRVRKVTRVVRSVDPWSVFKIALIASLVLYVIVITSGVLLWNVAYATGTVDNVERFFESFGWTSFEFNGGEIYHAAWVGGLFAALGLTGLAVLAAALFNLITDLVGGVRLTVLEEEVVETRTSPMRRFVVRRPAPEVPALEDDLSGSLVREAVVDDSGAIVRRSR